MKKLSHSFVYNQVCRAFPSAAPSPYHIFLLNPPVSVQTNWKRLADSQRNTVRLQGGNIVHIDQKAVVDAQKAVILQLIFQLPHAIRLFRTGAETSAMWNLTIRSSISA